MARVDPADSRPAFRQIADQLRDRILGGDLRPGGLLPSETELLTEFGASRSTVRHSIEVLKSEGLIETRQGRGPSYARSSLAFSGSRPTALRGGTGKLAKRPSPSMWERIERRGLRSGGWRGPRLRRKSLVDLASPRVRKCSRAISASSSMNGRCSSTSYLPYRLVHGSPIEDPKREPWPGGTIAQLETVGIRVTTVVEEVSARFPLPAEVGDLELKAGTPVFLVARTMFTGDGPVVVSDLVVAADQYVLSYCFPID